MKFNMPDHLEANSRQRVSLNVVDKAINDAVTAEYALRETWMKAVIKPKPRWMPQRLWLRLVSRVVTITMFTDRPSR